MLPAPPLSKLSLGLLLSAVAGLLLLPALVSLSNQARHPDADLAPLLAPATSGGGDSGAPADADPQTWRNYPYKAGPFTFPDDEGLHPAALEEWWYLNGSEAFSDPYQETGRLDLRYGPNRLLQLEGGTQLLVYKIIDAGASGPAYLFASSIDALGSTHHLEQTGGRYQLVLDYRGYWRSPETRILYSSGWELALPELGTFLSISPLAPAQELLCPFQGELGRARAFWEGSCLVSGVSGGREVSGLAFVETTLNYGSIFGDLVVTPRQFVSHDGHSMITVRVENRGGAPLHDVVLQFTAESPLEGGEILAVCRIESKHNSTSVSERLPETAGGRIWVVVDPDNTIAESDEGNNIAAVAQK